MVRLMMVTGVVSFCDFLCRFLGVNFCVLQGFGSFEIGCSFFCVLPSDFVSQDGYQKRKNLREEENTFSDLETKCLAPEVVAQRREKNYGPWTFFDSLDIIKKVNKNKNKKN